MTLHQHSVPNWLILSLEKLVLWVEKVDAHNFRNEYDLVCKVFFKFIADCSRVKEGRAKFVLKRNSYECLAFMRREQEIHHW